MKNIFVLSILTLASFIANAQKNVTLTIAHKLGEEEFAFNQTAQNNFEEEFQVTRIDYYISGIEIIHDGGMTLPVPDKYILAKGSSNVSELLGNFDVTDVEGIKFSIGVEAPTNNEDPSLQPEGSPLSFQDPSMHWGWAAGYRFVALEGKTGSGFATTFELHGLGNANYFQQTVMAPGVNSGSDITINLDADYTMALRGINVTTGPIEHGVNEDDLTMLKNFRDFVFKPGPGLPSSVNNVTGDAAIRIFPNPSRGTFTVDVASAQNKITAYRLTDISGREVEANKMPGNNVINLKNPAAGTYFLTLYNNESRVLIRKVVIE